MTLQLRIAAHSEIGLVRKNNQDSGYASQYLLVVADGMGGAAAGDLASAVAIDTIRKVDGPTSGEQMLERLAGAMHKANDRIADLVEDDYSLEGMGTTVTGALFDGLQFGLAHIGDSRAYLLHDGRLERLTHDHSWVQSLVDNGKIKEHEAAVHPHRSLLLKVLNGQPANDPDLTLVRVATGDRLLLCSDGLCGLVDDPAIEQAMRQPDLETALARLVEEALAEGGIDNITAILADVVESAPVEDVQVLGAAAERSIPPVETRLRGRGSSKAGGGDQDPAAISGGSLPGLSSASAGPGEELPDDEGRYHPQPPHRRRLGRGLVLAVVALLLVGAALGSAYAWTRTQYYVAAVDDKVAIFQGLDESLPGISLSRLYEVQPLAISALPPYYQERVRSRIDVPGLAAARQTVSELTDAARRCAKAAPTPQAPAPRPSDSAASLPTRPAPSAPVASRPATSRPATNKSPSTRAGASPPASRLPSASPGSTGSTSDSATPTPAC